MNYWTSSSRRSNAGTYRGCSASWRRGTYGRRQLVVTPSGQGKGGIVPSPETERLRSAIDAVANALQSASLLSGRLRQQLENDARDVVELDEALRRAVSALAQVRPENHGQ